MLIFELIKWRLNDNDDNNCKESLSLFFIHRNVDGNIDNDDVDNVDEGNTNDDIKTLLLHGKQYPILIILILID